MTRDELLMAVVEAARKVLGPENLGRPIAGWYAMHTAISALDAHRPEPEGEMVTIGILRGRFTGNYTGSSMPDQEDPRDWQHVCNITFCAPPLPRIPEITATVAPVETGG